LLAALALARLLGAAEFGRNALALSWAMGLGAAALAGTDQLLLRELSPDGDQAWDAALRAFTRRRSILPTTIAAGIAVAVTLVALGASLLPAVLGIVVLVGAMRRRQAMLLAGRRTGLAQAGEAIGVPLLQLAVVIPLLWTGLARHSAVVTVSAYAVAIAAVVVAQSGATRLKTAPHLRDDALKTQRQQWARSSRNFAVVSTVVIAQASIDIWILGALSSDAQVGSYAVAARLAALVALPLTITTFSLAREIAVLHAAGSVASMQRDVTTMGRLAAAAAAAIAGAVLLAAPVLRSVLGNTFHNITTPLLILVAGQLANVVIGPVAMLLLMTGHERDVRNTLLASSVLNAGLTATLVPALGAVGAAIGAAVSLTAWNVVLRARVHERLGITTGPVVVSRLR
jgi:O-antigen/teichoic acid export membrane protein